MPKKTRQEKILARLRRLEQQSTSTPNAPEKISKSTGYTLKEISQTPVSEPIVTVKSKDIDYTYLRKDLRKIIILATLALLAEVILSLTASEWYAKLFPRLF